MQTSRFAVLVCTVIACLTLPVFAQVDRATLTGVVRDASDAVVPGATVTVTRDATGVRRTAVATEDGTWLVVDLAPGDNLVEAAAPGFQTAHAAGRTHHRPARPRRPGADGRRRRRNRDRAGGDAAARHAGGGAQHRRGAQRDRQPAAGHPQLGRPAVHHPRRPGRPLHRADRHDQRRPHRRRQHPWQPVAAEQLPARRRRQQLDLDQRPGAEHPGVTAVDRRHRRVPGGDQPVRRPVRPRAGRGDRRHHQVGHQPPLRHGLRLLPRRGLRRAHLFRQAAEPREAGQRPEPVRREPGRTHPPQSRLFLRRLRGHPHHPGRAAHRPRRHRRRAQRRLRRRDPRPAHRAAVPQQHHPGQPDRPGGQSRSWTWCRCPMPAAATTSSASPTSRTTGSATSPASISSPARTTACSCATSTPTAPASSPASSAGSSTAPRPRPGAATS